MNVSLIIPTYNKKTRLAIMLQSIRRLKYDKDLEIIIVNDGSNDGTQKLVEDFCQNVKLGDGMHIKLISTSNQGRSKARNVGIKVAGGELLIFTDDDLILSDTFVINHVKEHLALDTAVVHGQILSLPQLKFLENPATGQQYDGTLASERMRQYCITPDMFGDGSIHHYLQHNSRIGKFEKDIRALFEHTSVHDSYIRWIGFTGGNVSIRKKNIPMGNLFDPAMGKIWGCEDLEAGYRLFLNGMKFLYAPAACNYHMNHFRETSVSEHRASFKYFYDKHRNKAIKQLEKYFDKDISTLLEWKKSLNE